MEKVLVARIEQKNDERNGFLWEEKLKLVKGF